jgi:hypothetical protein
MVDKQLRRRGITDERVLDAMAAVPRELFMPEGIRRRAYSDAALPIGSGQTISQPWIVAATLEGLGLMGGERVLEVGGGSGYTAGSSWSAATAPPDTQTPLPTRRSRCMPRSPESRGPPWDSWDREDASWHRSTRTATRT